MTPKEKRYTSARSFLQALEEKLRIHIRNQPGYDIARIRRQIAFALHRRHFSLDS